MCENGEAERALVSGSGFGVVHVKRAMNARYVVLERALHNMLPACLKLSANKLKSPLCAASRSGWGGACASLPPNKPPPCVRDACIFLAEAEQLHILQRTLIFGQQDAHRIIYVSLHS